MSRCLCSVNVLVLLTLLAFPSLAQQQDKVMLDGISVLISSSSGDDSSSIPVLASDVELIARLLLVSRHADQWNNKKIDGATRFKARRLATFVRLLSHAANMVGEKIKPRDRENVVSDFEQRAGGKAELGVLLGQCGASRSDLEYWVTNFMLARVQLDYLEEQVVTPTPQQQKAMFKKGDHRFGDASFEDSKEAYAAFLKDEELQKVVRNWVKSVLVHGKVIFAK